MSIALKTVLLVEDNPEDIEGIARVLRNTGGGDGYRLLTAHSAQEALDRLAAEAVDCVLLDYVLPGSDGLELLHKLPREADKTLAPVIMLTGLGNEEIAVEAMKSGACDYLAKQVDGRHLKLLPALIERAMREHAAHVDKLQAEAALRQERNFISAVLDTQGALVVVMDAEGHIVLFNRACEQTTGYALGEVEGRFVWDFLLPQQEVKPVRKLFAALRAGHFPTRHENSWIARNGERHLIDWSNTALTDQHGAVSHVIATGIDITGQKDAEGRLRLAASVVDNIVEGVFVTDAQGRILSVNPAFTAITGYSEDEVRGRDPRILKSFHHDAAFYRRMWGSIREHGIWQGEVWNRRKNGAAYLARQTVTVIRDKGNKPVNYVSVFDDITELKQQEDRIQYQAYHDALTGLPNRVLLQDRLDLLLAQARRASGKAAVLFLDLDHFKEINDTLGHDVGDQMLQETARRLKACVRDSDTASRLGGDEFVLILSEISRAADAAAISEKILRELKHPFQIAGHELYISGSIGISLFPSDGQNTHDLMKNADAAMYLAKKLGRQGYQFYSEEITAASAKMLDIENGLRRALEQHEFFLLFQPQFDISSRELTSIEALLRWRHPQHGVLPPVQFIAAAEYSGLIVPLGEWVLRTACAQSKAWQDEGMPVVVSVNLSAGQFHHHELTGMVAEILAETGLEPRYLELEVAESTIMARPEEALGILHGLKQAGVRLSIDNFGSAYCSLRHLKQLPIDKLKIDRSFIHNLPGNAADAAMAASVIQMSHNLSLKVVAEGVEAADQAAFLLANGCDQFQGFYCGNPLPGEAIRELLQCAAK